MQKILRGPISHQEFSQAIQCLPDGGTLRLERAQVRLEAPITVSKPLNLEGDHRDLSWIVGTGLPFGLIFRGSGPWSLLNVSVARCGLKVEDGRIAVKDCRFAHNAQGVGIHIEGKARGQLAHCETVGNLQGIVLAGQCDMLITENCCQENGDDIVFQDHARGAALKNEGRIWVTALAKPILDGDFLARPAKLKKPEAAPEPELEEEDEDAFEQLLSKGLEDGAVTLEDIQEAFEEYGLTPDMFDLLVIRLADEGIEVVSDEDYEG